MGTNTGLGIGIGIPFKNNALGGDRPYLPPELKARLIGVWDNYGKKNTDADRNIIKNKIPNAGGDLEILNAAYKLNSGFGKYSEDFTTWTKSGKITSVDSESFDFVSDANFNLLYYKSNIGKDIPSFKVRIKLKEKGKVFYNYITSEGVFTNKGITSEEYVVPISYNTKYTGETPVNCGFSIDITSEECSGTITQIPNFEGAFVTDGVDDLITSTKTVQEMGITDEVTVVSMIHQIDKPSNFITTNNIRTSGSVVGRNAISLTDKTGIYGWYKDNIQGFTINVINNILGDKADYTASASSNTNLSSKFSVVGYISNDSIIETSQVAWYWTIIANKVLTTDEINQVIAYFNLDRTLKPDILCNISKQGITNDNHAEFNDKLIDYSGNGRDIQMNNLAWKGGSGIAAKKFETIKDYLIVPDEGLQELTIYNEFSFKIKSIRYADRYWAVQSLNKTDMSYPVTIITDKDIIWRNALNYTDADGVKGRVEKETNVPANTPTQVFIYGFNDFDISDDYTKVNCVSYATRTDITEFTVTFIPSYKGGILLDGINDFGKVTGMPIYKDYTFIIDYERISYISSEVWTASVVSKAHTVGQGAFILMLANREVELSRQSNSFGSTTTFNRDDFTRTLLYQSKYKCGDVNLTVGEGIDGDTLWLGTLRDNDYRFFNGAIYSLMSFPYSMSKFLIERQLKKHKLGTFYPNMVEFRPVIKANANYKITCYQIDSTNTWKLIKVGDYIVIGAKLAFQITFDNDASELKEVVSPQLSDIIVEKRPSNPGYNIYSYITSKSPQKINITIDEYIRYEDIVQPYPVVFQITDRNTNQRYSWGDKIKVGSSIQLTQGEKPNLLSGLYSIKSYEYEGKTYSYNQLTNLNIILTKQSISLSCNKTWLLDDNEPKCILSPRLLSIPNSSYKILGYIPDISGHGNNGVINNSAYAEGSGVNEDGSYQFDGVDDFVTIPTVTGGKQVLMKVNWQSDVGAVTLYDQRLNISDYEFAIYNGTRDLDDNPVMAYQGRNNGQTYIDGILNSNIMASELKAITHNITITNELSLGINNTYPVIGSTRSNTHFAQMSLYDFMLFDEISTDDKIKELNEYVGIEAKVELPPYYWDTYGKTNLDADKATIQQRGVAVGNYDLTNYNHAYDKMSGYGGYKFAKFDNELDWYLTPDNGYIDVVSRNGYSITLRNLSTSNYGWYFQNSTVKEFITKDIPFKVKANKSIRVYWDMHSYKSNGENFGYVVNNITLNPNEDTSINLRHLTEEELTELDANKDRMYYLLWFDLSTLAVDEEVTIEMLPLYPNGLLYDGVTDYSENVNIPTFNDFTLLVKASLLNGFIGSGGSIAKKGNNNKVIGGGYDFIYALDSSTIEDNRNSYWSFGAALRVSNGAINPPLIGYMTKNNVNGVPMSSGANPSIEGITFSKWEGYIKMVLYKAMLYPKTIPLLQINFLKNLMEKDEIIDLTNPIFIKNE